MRRQGRVAEFDDHKGYGFIETGEGERLFFHCTAIADGSRSVPVGVEVEYVAVTDPRGQPEAAEVTPVERPPTPSSSARRPNGAG